MKSIKKNFVYNTLLSISQVLFPLIVFPYISRVLGPAGIGQVSFIESVCRYLILISALGIPIYGVREVARIKGNRVKEEELVSEILAIHFFSTSFIVLIYIFFILAFSVLKENLNFYLLGIVFVISNIFNVEWYFQGIEEFKFITLRSIIVKCIITILTFILVKNNGDQILYFLTIVMTLCLNAILNFYFLLKRTSISLIQIRSLKKHIKPLIYIFSSTAFVSIYTLSDSILLGLLSNTQEVGFYTIGQKLSRIPILFIGAISVVLIPRLSTYFKNNDHKMFNQILTQSFEFVVFFSIPIIFFIIGNSKFIILEFAGGDFIQSSEILIILSFLSLLVGLSNIFGLQILTPSGNDKYFTISVFSGMVVSIILNYFFIPLFGARAAALSCVVSEIIVTIITYYYARKLISLKLNFFLIIKISIFSLPIIILSYLTSLMIQNLFLVVFLNLIFCFSYTYLLHFFVLKTPIFIKLKENIFNLI